MKPRSPVASVVASSLLLWVASLFLMLAMAHAHPRPKAIDTFTLVGEWQLEWGASTQTCWFAADGGYQSCRHGDGTWFAEEDGDSLTVWFSERTSRYAVAISKQTLTGGGYAVNDCGAVRVVNVTLRRVGNAERKPEAE